MRVNALDKGRRNISRYFNRIAPYYDFVNHCLSLSLDTLWRSKAVRALNIQLGDLVLDIATGTGELAMTALRGRSCRVVGVDFSGEMLELAGRKRDHARLDGRFSLVMGDATSMPFGSGVFDCAMSAFGIRNVADTERLFRETLRVLKHGGRLAVLEFSLPRAPLFKMIYLAYFTRILPRVAGALSGDRDAYCYLRDSVMAFDSPEQVAAKMEKEGFRVLQKSPVFFGVCHIFIAEKVDQAS
jgi:demethylmenaquinone methyltransferase / 2-methoxy-6-polyprenyl-1,4-benzoquinol methylase